MACVEFANTCYTAGDTITIDWLYTDDEGTPIDLTGATAQMQLLNAITDLTQVIDMTGGITDAENGAGTFSLTKVESQSLLPIVAEGPASKSFVSKIRFEFSDTTTRSVAGLNVDIEQSGIR
jgi:hypothetical protein